MIVLRPLAAVVSVAAGWYGYVSLQGDWAWGSLAAGLVAAFIVIVAFPTTAKPRSSVVVTLRGITWTTEDFCRGWLITGDTGSGKTRSGITPLLYQVFKNSPGWGGLCIDDKGLYWETLSAMARHFNREQDLILLQVRPETSAIGWQPKHTFNLGTMTA